MTTKLIHNLYAYIYPLHMNLHTTYKPYAWHKTTINTFALGEYDHNDTSLNQFRFSFLSFFYHLGFK